jgi:hypothetical protein
MRRAPAGIERYFSQDALDYPRQFPAYSDNSDQYEHVSKPLADRIVSDGKAGMKMAEQAQFEK